MTKISKVTAKADGSLVVGVALEFDRTEASYIRSAAGALLSGAPVSTVGISTSLGVRWVLREGRGRRIVLQLGKKSHELDPELVMQAFDGLPTLEGAPKPGRLPLPLPKWPSPAEIDLINLCNHTIDTEAKVAALRAYVAQEQEVARLAAVPEWKERAKEFETFELLLREVRAINSGSCALDRITRCIEWAEQLAHTDIDTPRRSFLAFIRHQFILAIHGEEKSRDREEKR